MPGAGTGSLPHPDRPQRSTRLPGRPGRSGPPGRRPPDRSPRGGHCPLLGLEGPAGGTAASTPPCSFVGRREISRWRSGTPRPPGVTGCLRGTADSARQRPRTLRSPPASTGRNCGHRGRARSRTPRSATGRVLALTGGSAPNGTSRRANRCTHVGPELIKDEPGYLLDRQMAMAGHNVTVGVERHQVEPFPRLGHVHSHRHHHEDSSDGIRMSKEACGPDVLVVAYG